LSQTTGHCHWSLVRETRRRLCHLRFICKKNQKNKKKKKEQKKKKKKKKNRKKGFSRLSLLLTEARTSRRHSRTHTHIHIQVRPCTLSASVRRMQLRLHMAGKCTICGLPGISDAYYCKECTLLEKDRDGCPKIVNLGTAKDRFVLRAQEIRLQETNLKLKKNDVLPSHRPHPCVCCLQ
jgi:hypothetical protein